MPWDFGHQGQGEFFQRVSRVKLVSSWAFLWAWAFATGRAQKPGFAAQIFA
jgi:hypothetical protein